MKKDLGLSDWINHIFTQQIGVTVADHSPKSWKVLPEPLIITSRGESAHSYMVNPSVCETPDGNYLMMLKKTVNQMPIIQILKKPILFNVKVFAKT